jgi:hypothetical protein
VLVAIPNAVVFSEMVLNRTNERKPADVRVAADNERATPPGSSTPAANGRADQSARSDGAAATAGSQALAEPGRLLTGPLFTAAVFAQFSVLRPVAQGLRSSARATIQAVPFVARADVVGVTSRITAWLPRLRARARAAFER